MAQTLSPTTTEILDAADARVESLQDRVYARMKTVRRSVTNEDIVETLGDGVDAVSDLWDWNQMLVVKADPIDTVETELLAIMLLAASAYGELEPDAFVRARTRLLAGNMLAGVRRSSRRAVQHTLNLMLSGRASMADTVATIRRVVGLTEPSAGAVVGYREALVSLAEGRTTAAAIRNHWTLSETAVGVLTPRRIEELVESYSDRLLLHRATSIAQTEAVRAANAGAVELWRQQQRSGLISTLAQKVWVTAGDERVCPVCGPLDGEPVALSENFTSDGGGDFVAVMMDHPPAHTRCRCSVRLAFA